VLFDIEDGLFILLFSGKETDYFESEMSLSEEVGDGSQEMRFKGIKEGLEAKRGRKSSTDIEERTGLD
jgi:hypothetical protein